MDHPISSPASAAGPTARAEGRLPLLDALRGLAALGILWRNIFVFGLPTVAFTLPEEWGLSTASNVFTWLFVVIFVDGTMRGLFSMLFGATAILIMARHERNPGGVFAADLYFRRLMWLVAFGLVHGYLLLWPFDVLYVYGLLGMFLFVFRNMSGRALLAIALVLFAISSVKDGTGWSLEQASIDAFDAKQAAMQASGETDTAETAAPETGTEAGAESAADASAQEGPSDLEEAVRIELEDLERLALAEIDERLAPYPDLLRTIAAETFQEQTTLFFTDHVLDVGAMMFFGMALFRLGAFSGRWPLRRSTAMAAIGLSGGVVLGFLIHGTTTLAGFENWQIGTADAYLYNARRLLLCLGLIGLFDVLLRRHAGVVLLAPLAAVGRIPLTTYVGQTVVCIVLFYGLGFGLFGTFEHHELLLIAFAINAVQIVLAVLWARTGRQGPLEALLRFLIRGGGVLPERGVVMRVPAASASPEKPSPERSRTARAAASGKAKGGLRR
ncbi:MAG: hypothetical protein CMN87_11035 [Stappia sp.]|uniref:DUF418 domain-containing protein n=1 Tax=Stappia sp. TaxID=1870903 RepID=UPI000C4D9C8A|nr:DUF418 domain-containing protein [Stappia sp.]MAA98638.1 hypothetical protein [Stappia sp.]MBM20533.1 hypothetical protein [Stappia sp.]